MNMSQENKSYLLYITKYLGVALIAGSVVHIGTLDTGAVRYVMLMAIGLALMIFSTLYEEKQLGTKINARFLLIVLSFSIAIGFLTGGVQHYLDNPTYAGYLLAIGLVVTYVTFFLKERVTIKIKGVVVVSFIALGILFVSNVLLHNYGDGAHSHSEFGSHTK